MHEWPFARWLEGPTCRMAGRQSGRNAAGPTGEQALSLRADGLTVRPGSAQGGAGATASRMASAMCPGSAQGGRRERRRHGFFAAADAGGKGARLEMNLTCRRHVTIWNWPRLLCLIRCFIPRSHGGGCCASGTLRPWASRRRREPARRCFPHGQAARPLSWHRNWPPSRRPRRTGSPWRR